MLMESKNKEDIERRAYQLWQARGCPDGSSEMDWYEAELQLSSGATTPAADAAVDESGAGSFPASDAPATHIPDKPPSNAGAKWAAAKTDRGRGGR
jgi:hypothetical protein